MAKHKGNLETIGQTEVVKAHPKLVTLGTEGNNGVLSHRGRRFKDLLIGCKG